jgi:hypothetical protein
VKNVNLSDETLLEDSPEILAAAQRLQIYHLRCRGTSMSNVTRCFSVGQFKKAWNIVKYYVGKGIFVADSKQNSNFKEDL